MATFVFTCDRVVKIRSQALHQIVVEIFFRRVSSEWLFFLYCVHYFVASFNALDLWALTQSSFAQILAIFFVVFVIIQTLLIHKSASRFV